MSIMRLWRTGGLVLAIGFLTLFIGGGARHGIGLVLKPMAEGLDWDRSLLGAVFAVFMAVTAGTMVIVGRLADRFSPVWILGGGFVISAIGVGLMGLTTTPWQAFLLYGVIFAVGNGAVSITPVGVMITRRFGPNAGLANAIAIAGIGLGQLVILAGMSFVLEASGWRDVFFWLGAINLAIVPVIVLALRREATRRAVPVRAATGKSLGEAARMPAFWLLLSVYGLCGFQDFFVSVHVVAFALDQGIPQVFAGNILAFMGIASLVGVLLAGVWSDKVGPVLPTMACFLLRFVIFAIIAVVKDPVWITAFALMYGLTFLVTAPLTIIFVRQLFGAQHLGALTGIVTMTHHVSGGLGALAGAALFDRNGDYQSAFIAMIVISAIGAVLSWRMR